MGGIIVTGLGIWALIDKVPWIGELVGNDLLTGAVYVLLVGGIVVAFIAFFGCIGASREVKCMLLTVSIEHSAISCSTIEFLEFPTSCLSATESRIESMSRKTATN